MSYDLVIRNGWVVDGSGNPRYRGDVGIVGDTIASIGRIRERGRRELDAQGQVVAPGFIEVHSHMDAQVFWDPLGTSPVWHGVTTTVMGNCGFTLAPCREAEKDLCLRSLERAEDMSRDALLAGVRWSWETFAQYLDAVDALPKGIHYAGFIGHSALRTYVMGERAYTDEPTEDDLTAMCREVEAALKAGAIGFSTSRSRHFTSDGRPVASRVAPWREVQAIVRSMAGLDAGILEITPDNWGSPEERAAGQAALEELAVETGRPVSFITIELPMQGPAWREMMALTTRTAQRGGRMIQQVLARHFQSVIGFPTQLPFDGLPAWREIRGLPLPAQAEALRDPRRRALLVHQALHGPYATEFTGPSAQPPKWDEMMVLDAPTGPYRTVGEIAGERGVSPADAFIDIALEADLQRFFVQPIGNHSMADVLTMMRHPHAIIGGSDSGAHVSQILDASMPTYLLAYWVREQRVFTLEEGVRKLTLDPALAFGLWGRGLLAPGMAADLVVFDPDRVGPGMPHAARDLPAGALRLKQKATGMTASIVAGQVVMQHNEPTGALPGRLLRGPLAHKS